MKLMYKTFRKLYILTRNLYIKVAYKNIKIGINLNYRSRFRITISDEGKLSIGDNVFFNNDCSINIHQNVSIGDGCILGEGVKIYDHNHRFNLSGIPIREQGFQCKDVIIGRNCWIGSNVVILSGSIIGDNCVIGAGSVINTVIPDNYMVTSNRELNCNPIKYKQ